MRTYENSVETDALGRYYTRSLISELLVNALPECAPTSVIDIAAGDGSLSCAALARWRKIDLVTIEVDSDATEHMRRRMAETGFSGRHIHISGNALDLGLRDRIRSAKGRMPTIAVCNPPFQVQEWKADFDILLDAVGLGAAVPAVTTIDSALVFLAQTLLCLPPNGTLGIVVPDSMVSASKYALFREQLLASYDVVRAIRLPRSSCFGTDALAHILVVSKSKPRDGKIVLSELTSLRGEVQSIEISKHSIGGRLDFRYHTSEAAHSGYTTLRDVGALVQRGTMSSAEVRESRAYVLHTKDFKPRHRGRWINFSHRALDAVKVSRKTLIAQRGDILVARVGRNLATKVMGVGAGKVALSDCVFRIRLPKRYREEALGALSSADGERWIAAHSYGVAAGHITKAELIRFPLRR